MAKGIILKNYSSESDSSERKIISTTEGTTKPYLSVTYIQASSAFNKCDVNHDGDVDIIDVIYINKFLAGLGSVPNTQYLDANLDKFVSAADSQCIMASITNVSYSHGFIYPS